MKDLDLYVQAHALFVYRDGCLYNKFTRNYNALAGARAGRLDNGYRRITIKTKQYREHRLVFLMHHGYLPSCGGNAGLDHINGVKDDNRIENLREATNAENVCNRGTPDNNTSGVKGAYMMPNGNWRVQIRHLGILHCFGMFGTKEQANNAAIAGRQKLHGAFAN